MSALKAHKEARHQRILYQCDKCEFSVGQAAELKEHKEMKHGLELKHVVQEQVVYPYPSFFYSH